MIQVKVFTNILIALDGSVGSLQALDLALRIARGTGAHVNLCSVLDPAQITERITIGQTPRRMLEKARSTAARIVEEGVERARTADVKATGEVLSGPPAAEILEYARDLAADLIAMGTRGRPTLKRLMTGSVAEAVLREAPCPVLIVRETAKRG
jgi:nucleotide-binding universal stress UspA family protein